MPRLVRDKEADTKTVGELQREKTMGACVSNNIFDLFFLLSITIEFIRRFVLLQSAWPQKG